MSIETPVDSAFDIQAELDAVVVGKAFSCPMTIEGFPTKNVRAHCVESTATTKTLKLFSHGVEIREVKATKENGKWVPR